MIFSGLDLETAPNEGHPQVFALQPWRAMEEKARVTCCSSVLGPAKPIIQTGSLTNLLDFHRVNAPTATWNGIFDIAWLIASGYNVDDIRWFDAMLLWKWVDNSQRKEYYDPNWSLVDGVKRWLKDVPWQKAFIDMKKNEPPAGERDEYWELRAKFDALAAKLIAERAWACLTDQQRRSATIEARCLVPVAKSWLRGIEMDCDLAEDMMPAITNEMEEIESRLGVRVQDKLWVPSPILRSPKQLGETMYDVWKFPCSMYTEKGARATNKAALTYLADHHDKALEILRWRELNTQLTKFIQGPMKTHSYLGSTTTHPGPRLFSTYTGRMTYSTKSSSKGEGAKARVGIPIHQTPRLKAIRKLVKPPKGKALIELDASGQEGRFMAELSQDSAMLQVFNSVPPHDDIHSYMGSRLCGMSFEAFLKAKADSVAAVVSERGYRYQGKFTNLSCQYRIGAPSLRIKSRVDYGMDVDIHTAKKWKDAYVRAYPGVKQYWRHAINIAKGQGYAESLAGRRFKLTDWGSDKTWGTEQSAINFPIQGSGGDQKELALATISEAIPDLEFAFDLHDGLFFYADINDQLPELIKEAKHLLDGLNYQEHWGKDLSVPMTWDASVGINWGQMKELKF